VYNNLSVIEEEVTGHLENGYDKIRMNDSSDFSKIEAPCSKLQGNRGPAQRVGSPDEVRTISQMQGSVYCNALAPQQATGNALAVHFQTF
jgi:hypothetical protein